MLLAEKVEDLIKEGNQVKLVIVDSLMSHLGQIFLVVVSWLMKQKLKAHHALQNASYNLVVYVTNSNVKA